MEHKIALITGGARGLGRAMAESLLTRGVKVCVADILEEVGQATEKELAEKFGSDNVTFHLCDTSSQQQFEETWSSCEAKLGGKLDLLVNNAGIGDEQNWKKTLDINLGGYIIGTRLAMERMRSVGDDAPGNGGVVINVASIAGVKVVPFGPIYSATKTAVVGITRALGHPLHQGMTGVKVMCLCPALIAGTPFLQQAVDKASNPVIGKMLLGFASTLQPLELSEVVAAFTKLLDDEISGGVLVVEKDKDPFYSKPEVQ